MFLGRLGNAYENEKPPYEKNSLFYSLFFLCNRSFYTCQCNRWGNPDYDCSSFVISALKAAGFDVGGATYTQNMRSELTTRGFTWIPWSQIGSAANLRRGDILLNNSSITSRQHTEFYLGNNQ